MYLALHELWRNRTRFLMISLIFVLISWLVFILSGLGYGLEISAASTFKNMKADYVIFEQGSRASLSKSLLSEDLVQDARKLPGVEAASPLGISMATALTYPRGNDEKLDIAIIGVVPGSFLEPSVSAGRGLSANQPAEAIVNKTMQEKGFVIGDTFQLDGSTHLFTIVGFVENQTYNHMSAVFVPLVKWREIAFALPGSDKGLQKPANAIMLQGARIDPGVADSKLTGTETVTRSAAIGGLPGYKEMNSSIMMMLGFLMVIAAFMLGVFFYVFTMQKTNQFGVMKAIGAGNGFLGRTVVTQVFILSLASTLVGILLTYGTAAILPKAMPFMLDTTLLVTYSLTLQVMALLSSLVSVRKITRIDPLVALGRVE